MHTIKRLLAAVLFALLVAGQATAAPARTLEPEKAQRTTIIRCNGSGGNCGCPTC